jgi:hypothetical protein
MNKTEDIDFSSINPAIIGKYLKDEGYIVTSYRYSGNKCIEFVLMERDVYNMITRPNEWVELEIVDSGCGNTTEVGAWIYFLNHANEDMNRVCYIEDMGLSERIVELVLEKGAHDLERYKEEEK